MRIQKVLNEEALRSLGDLADRPVQNVADLPVLRFRDDRLRGRRHRNRGAMLPDAPDGLRDRLGIHEGPHAVMHQNDGIAGEQLVDLAQAVIDGLLPGLSTRNDRLHLRDVELVAQLPHLRNVLPKAGNHDPVDVLVVLELLNRIDDDGFPVELQKLLGNTPRVHSFARAARENQRDIHFSHAHIVPILCGLLPALAKNHIVSRPFRRCSGSLLSCLKQARARPCRKGFYNDCRFRYHGFSSNGAKKMCFSL